MKVAWKVERGDHRTKNESGTWLNKYNQRSPCEVSGVIVDSMRNPPPWNIKMDRRVCCGTNFYPVGHKRVLECEMFQSLKLSSITAHDFLDGWPLGHQVLKYAWLANVHAQRSLDFNTYQCEVDSLRLYRCLQTRNQIQKRQGPYG